jgi:hypothetical protein
MHLRTGMGFRLFLTVCLFAAACKKQAAFEEETGQVGVDVRMAQAACEGAFMDANLVVMDQSFLRGKDAGTAETQQVKACDVSMDTSLVHLGIVTMNYNGNLCNGRKKEGRVVISLEDYPLNKWKQKGSIMKMEFMDYVVTYPDQKSVRVNGEIRVTNETGRTWYELMYLYEPYSVNAAYGENLKANFDGITMIFHVARRYTFTYTKPFVYAQVQGYESVDGKNNVECWGKNREGKSFVSCTEAPLQWNTDCGPYSPNGGLLRMTAEEKYYDFVTRMSVDTDGNEIPYAPGNCAFGWKLSWTLSGETRKLNFPYN